MLNYYKLLLLTISYGLAATGLTLLTKPVQAFTLGTVAEGTTATNPFIEPKLFEVEWRTGASDAKGDYEAAIGPNGATTTAAKPQFQINWQKGVSVPWTIDFNTASGKAILNMANQTTTYYLPPELKNFVWDKLGLTANVGFRTDGLVQDGTRIELHITSINGDNTVTVTDSSDLDPSIYAEFGSAQTIFSRYFVSNSGTIQTMSGTIALDWDTKDPQPKNGGARSSIRLKLSAIESPPLPTSIPEPNALIGLMAVGLLGKTLKNS